MSASAVGVPAERPSRAAARFWRSRPQAPCVWEALEQDLADALRASEAPGLQAFFSSPRLRGRGCRRCGSHAEVEAPVVADEEAPIYQKRRPRLSLPSAALFTSWRESPEPCLLQEQKDGSTSAIAMQAAAPSTSSLPSRGRLHASASERGLIADGQQELQPPEAPRGTTAGISVSCAAVTKLNLCTVLLPFWQPNQVLFEDSGLANSSECAICFEYFVLGEPVRTLPCLHRYHASCVDPWLLRRWSCPLCKLEIGGGGYLGRSLEAA
eukprot:TRINITY_DN105068_c0_g1_i1.p1 TRINITY_DN105068_c0_g1~~TRINITY_DN105068_c0_g1_i1.p1  ORF type:complete len:268 (+),score=50.12 TRINITY_DN105068_c0_g1_i1:19-822(+)